MEQQKLILQSYKQPARKGEQNVIKINGDAMKTLEELQRATGLPIKQLASRMISFASEFVEIED